MDSSSAAVPVHGDRRVALDDVVSAYAVYLGRRLHDPDQASPWLGASLADMISTIVSSSEFANIFDDLILNGRLVEPHALTADEWASADRWLTGISSAQRPSPHVEWAELLYSALSIPELAALTGVTLAAEGLESLRADVERRQKKRAPLLSLTVFDAERFVSSAANRCYRRAGGVDFDAKIANNAAPVLLPLFTEGLSALRHSEPVTLGDWLSQTQTAALAGSLTHWLWEPSVYLRNATGEDASRAVGSSPFLDFLLEGDALGLAPHPLFCHHAYRTLNGLDASITEPLFRQYANARNAGVLRTSTLFDPEFYLTHHPRVHDEIARGEVGSALEHFVRTGMAQGLAFSPDFDRAFYLDRYPDVAAAVADGSGPSAEWHYIFHGAREGRTPNPFFDPRYYADRYPFIGDEMRRLGIATTIEHFLLLGRERGWCVNTPPIERSVAIEEGKVLFEKRGRRAFAEILDGAVSISPAEKPGLSVIVPISNQADFTAGFLKCAAFAIETLASRRGIATEIIVVDNGSSDHTRRLLDALPAVRVQRFDDAVGFPAAVNAGAGVARGDVLLVVNNDIEFEPDAFDRVIAALEADSAIGAVGAKIILPNETLQECGAMLDRLGSSHGFGRGSDAADVRGQRRVEVDYVSACFVAVRRSDFEALSGFDTVFSPGYFEDVDFALRMKRDLGKATVVDTGIAVIHYENASFARGRPAKTNSALILKNRARLKLGHAGLFRDMEAGRPRQRANRARCALTGSSRVLFIVDSIPARRLTTGSGRRGMILDALADAAIPFDIVALNPSAHADSYKDPRAKIFRTWMPGDSLDLVLRDRAGDYSHIWICGPHNVTANAAALAKAKENFDLTVICDLETLPSQRTRERMRLAGFEVDEDQQLSLMANDLGDTLDVDLWVAMNERDRALVERLGVGSSVEIGFSARLPGDAVPTLGFSDRAGVLFVGVPDDPAEAAMDDLEWLVGDVWPNLRGMDGARLTISGLWPEPFTEFMVDRFGDRIDFIGEVEEATQAEIYEGIRVVVAPSRISNAPAGQIIESLMAGVPVVTTDRMAQHMGLSSPTKGARKRPTEDRHFIATELSALYTDETRWRETLDSQRKAATRRFTPEAFVDAVGKALSLGDARRHRG